MEHEIATADALDIFGSIDINSGDYLLGWDTDQFPSDDLENDKNDVLHFKGWWLKKWWFKF